MRKRYVTGRVVVGHTLQLEVAVRKAVCAQGSGVGETTRTGIAGRYCSSGGGPGSIGIYWVIPGVG